LPSPVNAVALINFSMRKALLLLIFPLVMVKSQAQTDPKLRERLDSMLMMTGEMNLEKILDFTYPKLFTIAPREQMAEAMKGSFETEEFSTTLDSVKLVKIFPVFTSGTGKYAKILHTMTLRMKFKDSISLENGESIASRMEGKFGKGNSRFDQRKSTLVVFVHAELVAIKDSFATQWSFVNYDKEGPLTSMLFSKEVIEKLNTYK
jgi:hypothetical protein